MTHRLEGPRRDLLEHMQHQQNLVELQRRLRTMHAADVALVVRGMALGRLRISGARRLLAKERLIGLLNGAVWVPLSVSCDRALRQPGAWRGDGVHRGAQPDAAL